MKRTTFIRVVCVLLAVLILASLVLTALIRF